MQERMKTVGLSKDAALHVICHQCPQVLYISELDNHVTRTVAQLTADSHSQAFSEPHKVSVFNGPATIEFYKTEYPESLVQKELPA